MQLESIDEQIFGTPSLRRIVRENHGKAINQCLFPRKTKKRIPLLSKIYAREHKDVNEAFAQTEPTNILCTVGSKQLNTYDISHFGDHLDLVTHFTLDSISLHNEEFKKELSNAELLSCCFLRFPNNFYAACAGTVKSIHVIDLIESREVSRLFGHRDTITTLQDVPNTPLFLSSSKDNTIRLWDAQKGACLKIWDASKVSAFCLCENKIIFGTENGNIFSSALNVDLQNIGLSAHNASKLDLSESHLSEFPEKHSFAVDCLASASGVIVSKCVSGTILVWNSRNEVRG